MIKAIIFDFDGVLVESVDIKTRSFARLFESEGKEVVDKVLNYHLQHGGVSRYEKFNYIYNNILCRQLTDEIFNDLCKRFSKLVFGEVVKAPYVKGSKEFLDNNTTNYIFFVCSATPQKEIESIIQRRNMSIYFKEIYGSPLSKAEIIQKILNNNNLSSQEIVYVGDSLTDYEATKDKQIFFIARINNNDNFFKNNNSCIKINDLSNLEDRLRDISNSNVVVKNHDIRIKKVFDFLSLINKEAYNDIFMLSNQVLSKNPYTSNFIKRYLKQDAVKQKTKLFIVKKIIKYYFYSLKDFKSYILELFEFYMSSWYFQHLESKEEIILIDSFYIIKDILEKKVFQDNYFPGLPALLRKKNKIYAFLPVFDGMKNRFTIYKIFKILNKQKIPVLSEYQLLSFKDFLYILYFILIYPIRLMMLIRKINNDSYDNQLLKEELINTLHQVTFLNFSRYLQGIRIASLPYKNIKLISWYENQPIDKNLYRGLKTIKNKIKIYGAQLQAYSDDEINLIPDRNEKIFGIIPDKILVNGASYIPKESNFNYAIGPSFRYAKIFDFVDRKIKRKNILVVLPYYKEYSRKILNVLREMVTGSLTFIIKPHACLAYDEFKSLMPSNATFVNGDIYKLFESTKILIGAASGTLVEAAALGIPVIFISSSNMIKGNPLPDYGKGIIWEEVSNANELQIQIDKFDSKLINNLAEINNIARFYRENLFCKPEEKNIVDAFDL